MTDYLQPVQDSSVLGRFVESALVRLGLTLDPATIAAEELAIRRRIHHDNERVRRNAGRRVGAAVRIVMAEKQTTATEALELLVAESRYARRTLYDVAEDVVEIGRAPVDRWQPHPAS